jgi:hypothetical protein
VPISLGLDQFAECSQYENDRTWTHWLEGAWAAARGCSLCYDSRLAIQPPNTCSVAPNRERLRTSTSHDLCLSNSRGYALGLIRGPALKVHFTPHKANGDKHLPAAAGNKLVGSKTRLPEHRLSSCRRKSAADLEHRATY